MAGKNKYVIALGTFDGLHKGHESVLNSALAFKDYTPIAVTFDEPPKRHTTGTFVPMLLTAKEKNNRLKTMGFKKVEVLDYNKVHNLLPEQFLDMLFEKYCIKAAVCGFNYRFGKDGSGDAALLSAYCHSHGAEAVVCPVTTVSGQTVSSTLIRELIADGNISFANTLLTQPFCFTSTVIHGEKRGHTLGFPTINQELNTDLVTPKFGVYATSVTIDGHEYAGVTNIGVRPTYILNKPLSETYILDFNGDVYGKDATIKLLDYLRPEERFENAEQLKTAIANDAEKAIKQFDLLKNLQKQR